MPARQVNGSLKCGILGFLIVESDTTRYAARKRIRQRASGIKDDVQSSFRFEGSKVTFCLGNMRRFPESYECEKEWFAASCCITLSS